MHYKWMFGTHTLTEKELAEFTAKNAHQFYEKANRFRVREDDGYEGRGGEESVYREDAFQTAAEVFGVPYAVFYDAWLNASPISAEALLAQSPKVQ